MEKLKFEAFPLIKSGLSIANAMFLFRLCSEIGEDITYMSFRDIGNKLGMTYENVRYHFAKLQKRGFITIEKVNSRKAFYHINMEKVNKLL